MQVAITRRINTKTALRATADIMAKHGIQDRSEMAKPIDKHFIHEVAFHYTGDE